MSPIIKKEALPSIDAIANEYVSLGIQLQKSGQGFKTLCPFPEHLDSKPSFFIYPDGGFHCFGCGAHGSLEDIYAFFDKDFSYHTSRIDLTLVPDSAMGLLLQLRKNYEKRLCLLMRDVTKEKCFSIYDAFDCLWIDLNFLTFSSRLQIALVVKRNFRNLLNVVEEECHARNE